MHPESRQTSDEILVGALDDGGQIDAHASVADTPNGSGVGLQRARGALARDDHAR